MLKIYSSAPIAQNRCCVQWRQAIAHNGSVLLQLGNLKNVRSQLKLNKVLKVEVKNKKQKRDSSARTSAEKTFEADCSNVQPQLQQYLCWLLLYFPRTEKADGRYE